MGVFIGFVVGYLFGVSNNPIDLAEVSEAWQNIKQSEDFQALMAGGVMMARQALALCPALSLKKRLLLSPLTHSND
jgi:hypothetical protein